MVLREGFRVANLKVKELLENNKEMYSGELPGAVGIVAVIIDRMLVYGSVGDCMGILVRGNQKIIFSQKQTTFAFDILEVENDRQCLMENYVNNINSEYGYGVVNGQDEAIDFFNISYVNLDKNDVIFLASDGVSDLIQFAKVESFIHKELEEILTMSDEQDLLAKKKYFDDKSVIKITITN
jgi:serine/threonine protein phosphatase PrpC